jgi:hypothetical protein
MWRRQRGNGGVTVGAGCKARIRWFRLDTFALDYITMFDLRVAGRALRCSRGASLFGI